MSYYSVAESWYEENKHKLSPLRKRVFRIWLKTMRRAHMKEWQFQNEIRRHGLTEYKIDIHITGRVGDENPGWAQSNVEAVIPAALARKGIMVDKYEVKVLNP